MTDHMHDDAQTAVDLVLLPRKLTAENGAKAALIGEFKETVEIMDEDGEEHPMDVPVSWDTIKRIWDAAVAHFAAQPPAAPVETGCCKGLAPQSECRCEIERKAAGHPPYPRCSAATEVLDFLNSIEGAGYGGMASFEIARAHVQDMLGTTKSAQVPMSESKYGLLPCPFCGAPARTDLLPHVAGPGWVQCSECECDQIMSDTLDEAVERWNRRAVITSTEPQGVWQCAARKQGTSGGNAPADCDWPSCGCDPAANKVLEALDEAGFEITKRGPAKSLQCLRCGTINAFGSISRESQIAKLSQAIEAEARRYAEMYPQSSDGRNTFVIFADWVASLALSRPHEKSGSTEVTSQHQPTGE